MLNYFQSSASTEKRYVPGPESTITEDFPLKQITNYVLPLEIIVSFLGFFFSGFTFSFTHSTILLIQI